MTRVCRAFTVLEVVLATSLASIVLLAAMGMFGFMDRTDRMLQNRLEDTAELGRLHETIRRAMQTLVATTEDAAPGVRTRRRPVAPAEAAEGEGDGEQPRGEAVEGVIDASGRQVFRRARFSLAPQIEGRDGEHDPRMLELVLLTQPAPGPAPTGPTIRGAFLLAPRLDGYALQWQPLAPPGEPVTLATRIERIKWSALAREAIEKRYEAESGAWRTDMAANTPAQYPKAVRLQLETRAGTKVDWIFEPAVTTGAEL